MSRANWKQPFLNHATRRHLLVDRRRGYWTTWSRRSTVTPALVGHGIRIHNGNGYDPVVLQIEHIGYTFGSLSTTKDIGDTIHRHNRIAVKKRKADALVRQRKARKGRSKVKQVVKKKLKN